MLLFKTLHPNRWFLYFIAAAFLILLGVYYVAQTYVIEEDTRYLEQPISADAQTPAQTAGDAIDTSGWKTYRNEEYGFEFKYPKDWPNPTSNVRHNGYKVVFGESNPLHTEQFRLGIAISAHIPAHLDEEIYQLTQAPRLEGGRSGVSVYDIQKYDLSGAHAYIFYTRAEGGFEGANIYAIRDSNFYSIYYSYENSNASKEEFLKVLSTLTFFEPTR